MLGVQVPPALLSPDRTIFIHLTEKATHVNRETKRMMQRQGQAGPDGAPQAKRAQASGTQRRPAKKRASIRQFFREVREEMRQVSWPTRPELINYTSITLFVLIVMIGLIYGLNLVFGKFVVYLFQN